MVQGNFNRYRGKLPITEMNVVPLVDVMLVLLVIFIVTAYWACFQPGPIVLNAFDLMLC